MAELEHPVDEGHGRRFNPEGFVYGVLALATVIAAESTRRETFPKLVGASLVIMGLYWLGHAYARFWGSRLEEEGANWSAAEILRSLWGEAPILVGASLPAVALLLSWAAGASIETAVTAVLWEAGAELVILEIVVGIRRHFGWRDMTIQTLIGVTMALGILVLRVILH